MSSASKKTRHEESTDIRKPKRVGIGVAILTAILGIGTATYSCNENDITINIVVDSLRTPHVSDGPPGDR